MTDGQPLAQWLRTATERLAHLSDTPRLDAELLAAHALGIARNDMLLRLRDLRAPVDTDLLLERRLRYEPIAHIIGTRDFWTLSLRVTPDVLIPRPDSETLIEVAVAHFAARAAPGHVLDLGTGSGALLLAALDQWPDAAGLGIDASPAALAVAADNAARCGSRDRATFALGDWTAGITDRFDLILSNPPYIRRDAVLAPDVVRYEPHAALFAGEDGLADYRRIVPDLARLVRPGGLAVLEIGHDQAAAVSALCAEAGLSPAVCRDLAGRDRCIAISFPAFAG